MSLFLEEKHAEVSRTEVSLCVQLSNGSEKKSACVHLCVCVYVSGQRRERQKPSVVKCKQSNLCEGYGSVHCMTLNYSIALKKNF